MFPHSRLTRMIIKKKSRDTRVNRHLSLRVRFHINSNHPESVSVWSYQQLIHFTFQFTACYGAAWRRTVYYAAGLLRRCRCCWCVWCWRSPAVENTFSSTDDFPLRTVWDWNQQPLVEWTSYAFPKSCPYCILDILLTVPIPHHDMQYVIKM